MLGFSSQIHKDTNLGKKIGEKNINWNTDHIYFDKKYNRLMILGGQESVSCCLGVLPYKIDVGE